ncbi:hypothetical protein N1851_012198 [Merluccius polli]|uniref:Uncharacterized protein n=1 Tax=Merluccius polli TaxID=89951 RepID=A0AA47MWP9_MERPO|nr:hypothetical protein N1851_012198 [Merluccius polli]
MSTRRYQSLVGTRTHANLPPHSLPPHSLPPHSLPPRFTTHSHFLQTVLRSVPELDQNPEPSDNADIIPAVVGGSRGIRRTAEDRLFLKDYDLPFELRGELV